MKTYPIRMRPDMQAKAKQGLKTETRRTNLNWLKVKAGDRLRVLKSRGLLLEATVDAREESLQDITRAGAIAEGIPDCGYTPDKVHPAYVDESREVVDFICLWDSIKTKPGEQWADNPRVAVLTFKQVQP